MATLQGSTFKSSSSSSSSSSSVFCKGKFVAVLHAPKPRTASLSLPKLPILHIEQSNMITGNTATTKTTLTQKPVNERDEDSIAKLYAIAEAVADRVEMHSNIGEQRDNWNTLLLNSINAITLAAATMAGLTAISATGSPLLALKLSSTLLYSTATGMLLVMNKIQPSQLAEEQRNAARLFRHLHTQIHTTLALGNPTAIDVKNAMEKVLALDRAYPLPLLPGMLEKFPKIVEPTVWWPSQSQQHHQPNHLPGQQIGSNGWSKNLEDEMRVVVGVLKQNDTADYIRLSKLVLKINRILASSGPILTGLAAVGSAFMGSPSHGPWAALAGVSCGALASVVNTLEHGGQVGMVFEMYRNCAGSYRLMEESIEWTLKERDVEKRENGELFEMKVALQLGRSLSELRNLASSSTEAEEFAGKLF